MEEGEALLLPCRVPPERRGKIRPWRGTAAQGGGAADLLVQIWEVEVRLCIGIGEKLIRIRFRLKIIYIG